MRPQSFISVLSLVLFFLHCTKTLCQSPAAAPAMAPPTTPVKAPPADSSQAPSAQVATSPGPVDVNKILQKAGHFTVFARLMQATTEDTELNKELNNTNNGITILAPTDNAFSSLKAGFLNSLSDEDKTELVKFHIIPAFISTSQFQTVSNPVRTQAGTGPRVTLNVTTTGNFVNISSGLTNTSISGTVYTDSQLAIYQLDKVLYPLDIFTPKPPAPAPEPALGKPGKAAPGVESPTAPKDISAAPTLLFLHSNALLLAVSCAPHVCPQMQPYVLLFRLLFLHATPGWPYRYYPNPLKSWQLLSFVRPMKATRVDTQLFSQLNNSTDGITMFAPNDNAFPSLVSGAVGSLNDREKLEFVQSHMLPRFLLTSDSQTLENKFRAYENNHIKPYIHRQTGAIYEVDKVPPAPAPAKPVAEPDPDAPKDASNAVVIALQKCRH
ncbi:hypothetical protein SADUNF_Sadunf09G0009700 [Salix dunnii]|uniref:FAS1 domain-containing protein n=1 Tax=Salix dunnii TaxID=1413687 RepID=A0A835JSF9_9ROSI|nr:hypothetical protein SADUNF_Sadunf09G0009700 [Salix dunnii]